MDKMRARAMSKRTGEGAEAAELKKCGVDVRRFGARGRVSALTIVQSRARDDTPGSRAPTDPDPLTTLPLPSSYIPTCN